MIYQSNKRYHDVDYVHLRVGLVTVDSNARGSQEISICPSSHPKCASLCSCLQSSCLGAAPPPCLTHPAASFFAGKLIESMLWVVRVTSSESVIHSFVRTIIFILLLIKRTWIDVNDDVQLFCTGSMSHALRFRGTFVFSLSKPPAVLRACVLRPAEPLEEKEGSAGVVSLTRRLTTYVGALTCIRANIVQ